MTAYGLLVYPEIDGRFNIGDYIQSIAARRFLPQVDCWVERERLSSFRSMDRTRVILNGWFMHDPAGWPPSSDLDPLVTSFHINEHAREGLTRPESIEYLKRRQPIGCRDHHTRDLLRAHGIEARFSGCLTLTLRSAGGSTGCRRGILLVDPVPGLRSWSDLIEGPGALLRGLRHRRFGHPRRIRRILAPLLHPSLLARATWIRHEMAARGRSHHQRFRLAEKLLSAYARAELVVTSRLHCALPCLAFGTPVLFVRRTGDDPVSSCRFGGLTELLNVVDVDLRHDRAEPRFPIATPLTAQHLPENPAGHRRYRAELESECGTFMARAQP